MALVEKCYCGLSISAAVIGVYLTIAYVIAFVVELWWILEAPASLPFPAYLLCFGYLVLFVTSSLLLHGLSVNRTSCLLIWMFILGLLLGPEAGLVLYITIHYWRVTSLYGLIELTCWVCRLMVNVAGIICVQSLYSQWRTEKSVLLRLHQLKMSQMPKAGKGKGLNRLQGYDNMGYQPPEHKIDREEKRVTPEENTFEDFYTNTMTEFNASTFDATVLSKNSTKEDTLVEAPIIPKTRSLVDLRESLDFNPVDFNNSESTKTSSEAKSIALSYVNYFEKKFKKPDNYTQSLDRRIIKNKNLKILHKLSPFLNKKTAEEELNIYRVNPPGSAKWESSLNQVFSRRGMYAYDEKTRKVVYYPPQLFKPDETQYRNRTGSYGSSISRSSADSDDCRRIGDVAL